MLSRYGSKRHERFDGKRNLDARKGWMTKHKLRTNRRMENALNKTNGRITTSALVLPICCGSYHININGNLINLQDLKNDWVFYENGEGL